MTTKKYKCSECEKEFDSEYSKYQHDRDKHGIRQNWSVYRTKSINEEHLTEADYQTWYYL